MLKHNRKSPSISKNKIDSNQQKNHQQNGKQSDLFDVDFEENSSQKATPIRRPNSPTNSVQSNGSLENSSTTMQRSQIEKAGQRQNSPSILSPS